MKQYLILLDGQSEPTVIESNDINNETLADGSIFLGAKDPQEFCHDFLKERIRLRLLNDEGIEPSEEEIQQTFTMVKALFRQLYPHSPYCRNNSWDMPLSSPKALQALEAKFRSAFLFVVSFFNVTQINDLSNRYEQLLHLRNIYPNFIDLTPQ
jgi:hypothetical protein